MILRIIFLVNLVINLLYFTFISCGNVEHDTLSRSRRQLLYPNSTLLQFNMGLGTPTPVKTINMNIFIQANFQLPWNRTQIPTDIFGANSGYVGLSRKKRNVQYTEHMEDAKLTDFYQYLEDSLNSYGINGTSCVLRLLCQLGAEPLHSWSKEDLLHELSAYLLNPLNDNLDESENSASPYVQAQKAGKEQQNCISMYSNCHISLVDFFSMLQ